MGHNEFSDLTTDEFCQYFKLGKYSPGVRSAISERDYGEDEDKEEEAVSIQRQLLRGNQDDDSVDDHKDLPKKINWKHALPPVSNQGMCGSCWAFSAVGAIEGAHFVDTGKVVSLSEQQFVDCDPMDNGCGGGLMDNAFLYDENSTGVCSSEDYPYVAHRRWVLGCKAEKGLCEPVPRTRVKKFIDIKNNPKALKRALTKQPVSVAIQANLQSFQFYKSVSVKKCLNALTIPSFAVD